MKILGITLVKNEDLYIRQALLNSLDFCDEIIVLDNNSTDNTWDIVSQLSEEHSHVSARRWADPMNSGIVLQPYVGKDYWVLGLDGDELYSPHDLAKLRSKILNGDYSNFSSIKGHAIHCVDIDLESKTVKGFTCPPSRTMTKLYNFSILSQWFQDERLHGPPPSFKAGYSNEILRIDETISWNESFFKCVHAAFVPRSSRDIDGSPRFPPHNSNSMGNVRLQFKLEKYRRGEISKIEVPDFFDEDLHKSSK